MLGSKVVLSPEGRMTLNASGAAAIYRLKELMRKKTHDPGLSVRELVVLQHLAQGLRLPAIAERLELIMSERTLETYVTSARKKLGAKTSTEAVAIAIRLRLI
jgi:DNA-binding NarL/FixJ family response regulator